jgi:murein DD-endopeptidase MepM/ murein hydrolase activator NlpD
MVTEYDGKEPHAPARPGLGWRTIVKALSSAILLAITLACAAQPTLPIITITSPQQDEQVKGTITLKVDLETASGRLDEFQLWLDGAQVGIPDPGKMGKKHGFELAMDTALLAEGKHTLIAKARSEGEKAEWAEETVSFLVDNQPLKLNLVIDPPDPKQGQAFFLKVYANKPLDELSVDFMEQKPQFFPTQDGSYIAALGARPSSAVGDYPISVNVTANGKPKTLSGSIHLVSGKFLHETIDMPVATSAKVLGRTEEQKAAEQEEIVSTVTKVEPELYEKGALVMPVEGRLTSPFYITRKFSDGNGESHNGVDYAAPEGTPIVADGAGIVRLAREHIARGKFVLIDHGRGWFSILQHMSEIDVEEGQMVEKGQLVGKVGMTGYANGDHLHWEMRLNRWCVDPRQFLTHGFEY